jgi:hypothetical protein
MRPRVPTVIAVEGVSDKTVLELIAQRLGRDGLEIVAIGGAHAIRRFVAGLGSEVGVRGLCDENEAWLFRRALPADQVFVCTPDLEGELIRAVGTERMLELADSSFRTLQQQPAQRGRPVDAQLHRWLRSINERSKRLLPVLAELAVELDRVPQPLEAVLGNASQPG